METKAKKSKISVQGTDITIISKLSADYICLTDMAKKFGDDILIYHWMRNRNTLEFLGVWEQIHNPGFKGLNSFHLSPKKWIDSTNAIGIQSRSGRYGGGTYAHRDLALFGITAKQWRVKNSSREGNIRDYASILQLLVLANLEAINAEYIRDGIPQPDRLKKLNVIAITQLKSLSSNKASKLLYETYDV